MKNIFIDIDIIKSTNPQPVKDCYILVIAVFTWVEYNIRNA